MSLIQNIAPMFKVGIYKHKNRRHKPREGMSESHLANIRKLRCVITGALPPCDPHHLKEQTNERGMGMRSSDKWAIPMCRISHEAIEREPSTREIQWFADRGIDCLQLARDLWAARGDFEKMQRVRDGHAGGVIQWL